MKIILVSYKRDKVYDQEKKTPLLNTSLIPPHQNIFYCTILKKLILALAKYKYIFSPLTIIVIEIKWWIVKIYGPAYAYIKRILLRNIEKSSQCVCSAHALEYSCFFLVLIIYYIFVQCLPKTTFIVFRLQIEQQPKKLQNHVGKEEFVSKQRWRRKGRCCKAWTLWSLLLFHGGFSRTRKDT